MFVHNLVSLSLRSVGMSNLIFDRLRVILPLSLFIQLFLLVLSGLE